jgi:hypothetical protein
VKWPVNAIYMGEMNIAVGTPEGKRSFRRHRSRWENNI